MPGFSISVPVQTGSASGTYRTLLALKMADTVGHQATLLAIEVGYGESPGDPPDDQQITLKIGRTDNAGDGSGQTTVPLTDIEKKNSASADSKVTAIGKNYTASPTTMGGSLGGVPFNTRSYYAKDFWDEDMQPEWGQNETLCILGTPGSDVAIDLVITLHWKEK